MALVTFRLHDFGFALLTGVQPVVRFHPRTELGSAITQGGSTPSRLLPSRPVAATVDSTGNGTVNLVPNEGTSPASWFEVTIEHLDAEGNFTSYDVLGFRLWVPAVGGDIMELPGVPPSPDYVLVSTDPPPPGYTGWYYNGGLGDPNDPLETGTGILYKVVA